jgi:hypothetical protein
MTKKEWLIAAKTAVEHYTELKSLCTKAYDIGALEEEGPIDTAMWDAFTDMRSIWDENGWVDWFIYDNRCGKSKATVRYNGKDHTISTITQLAEYLEQQQFFTPEKP